MTTGEVVHAAVADTPITPEEAHAGVDSPYCGAVVGFSGVVRDHDGGREVSSLSYSAHPSADRVIREVAEEIAARHDGIRIWVAHRVGPLAIGDQALVAVVGAAHRGEAFRACSDLVDLVKERVPIWKEQFFADGSVEWVGAGAEQ
ncbi:molybdenum cofactor biosynthesis protein MoaE [Arthrobacter sp. SX1312]|uniref:molybdenum cofactor biosynthesis protein MoaE n=1 Tax=Arthrobacter sp. SX1312 TaxID=2058896 RepID=UPI000CE338D5|nr:molybdenum cofactor biosynthesis protein MoaE [Arthrobacter sp. SX1312]